MATIIIIVDGEDRITRIVRAETTALVDTVRSAQLLNSLRTAIRQRSPAGIVTGPLLFVGTRAQIQDGGGRTEEQQALLLAVLDTYRPGDAITFDIVENEGAILAGRYGAVAADAPEPLRSLLIKFIDP